MVEVPISEPNMAAKLSAISACLHARQLAVLVDQAGAVGDADQRAGIVEHVDEQEAEHHDEEGRLGHAREVELQQRRRERRRQRDDAAEYCASPSGMPITVTTRMPISVPPMTSR